MATSLSEAPKRPALSWLGQDDTLGQTDMRIRTAHANHMGYPCNFVFGTRACSASPAT